MKTPAHRVIYTHGGGRLGNQVVRFAHWIAWARAHETEVEVLNLAFWPFARYFGVWREHPGCVFPVRDGNADGLARRVATHPRLSSAMEGRNRLQRAVQAAGRWLPGWQSIELDIAGGESLDLDDPAFLARVRRRAVTTCCGWKIASWRLVAEHTTELRALFRPALEFEKSAANFIDGLRQRHDVVIGVFMRQSDYREWRGGRFYFSTAQYAAWIRQLIDLHAGKRVAVVIASEVRQDPAVFEGLPCFFASGTLNAGGHWFESWVELSLCDVIVTPPSTFSATAAFLGGLALWPVVSADQVMSFDQIIEDGMVGAARDPVFSCSVK
jgi:hypothetical protein